MEPIPPSDKSFLVINRRSYDIHGLDPLSRHRRALTAIEQDDGVPLALRAKSRGKDIRRLAASLGRTTKSVAPQKRGTLSTQYRPRLTNLVHENKAEGPDTKDRTSASSSISSASIQASPKIKLNALTMHLRDYAILLGAARQNARHILQQWMQEEEMNLVCCHTYPVVILLDNILLTSSSSRKLLNPVASMELSYVSSLSPNQWFDSYVYPYLFALQQLFTVAPPRRYQVLEIAEEIVEAMHTSGIQFCRQDIVTFVSRPVVVHVLTERWMNKVLCHDQKMINKVDKSSGIDYCTHIRPCRASRRLEARRRASSMLPTQSPSSRNDDATKTPPQKSGETSHVVLDPRSPQSFVDNDLNNPQIVLGLVNVCPFGASMIGQRQKMIQKTAMPESATMRNFKELTDTTDEEFMVDEPNSHTQAERPPEPDVDPGALFGAPSNKEPVKMSSQNLQKLSHSEATVRRRMYVHVTDHHVCGGRGNMMKCHPGNMQFHKWKLDLMQAYLSVPPQDRRPVIQELLDRVYCSGGRYLQKDRNGWYELHSTAARSKCFQAFRDLRFVFQCTIAQKRKSENH